MKRYNIFLSDRLTRGKIVVYSLPYRDSLCAIQSFAVKCMAKAKKKVSMIGKSYISVGTSHPASMKTCYESFIGGISVKSNGWLSKDTNAGMADFYVGVETTTASTASEKFISCSLSIPVASAAHHTTCEKVATALLDVGISCTANRSEKSGNMSAEFNVAMGNVCDGAAVFESVDISPKNSGQIAISLCGDTVKGRTARLYDWDDNTILTMDGYSLTDLEFIEQTE